MLVQNCYTCHKPSKIKENYFERAQVQIIYSKYHIQIMSLFIGTNDWQIMKFAITKYLHFKVEIKNYSQTRLKWTSTVVYPQ